MAMDRICWDETFCVGDPQMDLEHQNLIAIINEMIDHHPKPGWSGEIVAILEQLTSYANLHFDNEERLLKARNYPHLRAQEQEHQFFRQEITMLGVDLVHDLSGQRGIPGKLLEFLGAWWVDHILVRDMQYRPFLEGLPAGPRGEGAADAKAQDPGSMDEAQPGASPQTPPPGLANPYTKDPYIPDPYAPF
jgi:hemerythrin-like metal-binding protein